MNRSNANNKDDTVRDAEQHFQSLCKKFLDDQDASPPQLFKRPGKKKLFKLRPSMVDRAIKTTNDDSCERANSRASTQSEQSLKKVLNSMRKSNDDTNSRTNNQQNEQGKAGSSIQKANEDANECANSHANNPQNKQDFINKILNLSLQSNEDVNDPQNDQNIIDEILNISQQANEDANNPKNAVSSTQKANDANKRPNEQNIKKVVSNIRKANDNVSERPNTRANSRAINLQNEQNMRRVISSTPMTCTRKPFFSPSTSTVVSPICESTSTKRKPTTCIQLFENNDSPIVISSSLSLDATPETQAKQNRLENFVKRLSNKKAPDTCNKMVQTSKDSNPKPLQSLKRLGRNCFNDVLISDQEMEELKNGVIPETIEAFIRRLDREILVNNENEQEVLPEVNDGIPWRAPSGLQEAVIIANSGPPASMEETLDDDDDTFLPKVLPQKKVFTNKKKVKQNLEEIFSKTNINSRKLLENKENEQNLINTRQKESSIPSTSRKEVVERSEVFETSGSLTKEEGRECRSPIPDKEQEKEKNLKSSRRTEREDCLSQEEDFDKNARYRTADKKREKEVIKESRKNLETEENNIPARCRSLLPDKVQETRKQSPARSRSLFPDKVQEIRKQRKVVEEYGNDFSSEEDFYRNGGYRRRKNLETEENDIPVRYRNPNSDKVQKMRKKSQSSRRPQREVVEENESDFLSEEENFQRQSRFSRRDNAKKLIFCRKNIETDESLSEEDDLQRNRNPIFEKEQEKRKRLQPSRRTEREVFKENKKYFDTNYYLSEEEDFRRNGRQRSCIPGQKLKSCGRREKEVMEKQRKKIQIIESSSEDDDFHRGGGCRSCDPEKERFKRKNMNLYKRSEKENRKNFKINNFLSDEEDFQCNGRKRHRSHIPPNFRIKIVKKNMFVETSESSSEEEVFSDKRNIIKSSRKTERELVKDNRNYYLPEEGFQRYNKDRNYMPVTDRKREKDKKLKSCGRTEMEVEETESFSEEEDLQGKGRYRSPILDKEEKRKRLKSSRRTERETVKENKRNREMNDYTSEEEGFQSNAEHRNIIPTTSKKQEKGKKLNPCRGIEREVAEENNMSLSEEDARSRSPILDKEQEKRQQLKSSRRTEREVVKENKRSREINEDFQWNGGHRSEIPSTSRKEVVKRNEVFETSSAEEDGRCRSPIPDKKQEKRKQLKSPRRTEREVVKENKKNCEINDGTLEAEGVERNTCRSQIPTTSKKQEKDKKLNPCRGIEKEVVEETNKSLSEEDARCRSPIPDKEQEKRKQLKSPRRTEREVVMENRKNLETNEEGERNSGCRSEIPATDKNQNESLFEEDNCERDGRHSSPVLDTVQDTREKLNSSGRTERKVVKESRKNLETSNCLSQEEDFQTNSGNRGQLSATDKRQEKGKKTESCGRTENEMVEESINSIETNENLLKEADKEQEKKKNNRCRRTQKEIVLENTEIPETSNCLSQDEDFPTNNRKRNQILSTDQKQKKVKKSKSGKVEDKPKKRRKNTTPKLQKVKSTGKKQVKKPEKDEEHNIETRSRNSKIDHLDNPTFEIVANLNEREISFNAPEVETNVGNCSGTIQEINNSESSNENFVDKSRERLRMVLEPLFDSTVLKTAKASTSKTQKTKQQNMRNESTSSKTRTTKRKVQSQSDAEDSTVPVEGAESGVRRSGRVRQQAAFPTAGYFTVDEDEKRAKKLFSLDTKYKMLSLQYKRKLSPIKEKEIEEEEGRTTQQTTLKNKENERGGKSGKRNRTKKDQKRNIEESETEREEVQHEENEPRIESVLVNDNQSDLDSRSVRELPRNQSVRSGRISKRSTIRKSEKKIADTIRKTMSETTKTIEIDGINCSFKNFSFQKLRGMPGVSRSVIDDRPYGLLKIEGGKMKPSQKSGEPLWFTVVEGQAEVGIQNQSSLFKEDETFFVPQGNEYYVKNKFKTKRLKLVFCGKDIIRKSN